MIMAINTHRSKLVLIAGDRFKSKIKNLKVFSVRFINSSAVLYRPSLQPRFQECIQVLSF